jgi:beta-lactam-binding protein with PASTA domain
MSKLSIPKIAGSAVGRVAGSGGLILISVSAVLLAGIVALVVFFAAVSGEEQTLVPDLTGKDILEALVLMQAKELYPRIQLRWTENAIERGMIIEQSPPGGAIVKAGRRIRLVVSQGIRLSAVENYVGRSINDVRQDIQAEETSGTSLLVLKEPFLYQSSAAPAGAILEQKPAAGTAITGRTELAFVVSAGAGNSAKNMPALLGKSAGEAAKLLSEAGIRFVFSMKAVAPGATAAAPFTVSAADYPAGTPVVNDKLVTVQVSAPSKWEDDEVCAMFSWTLPPSPVSLPLKLEALTPDGARSELVTEHLTGGQFTWPYLLPAGSILILSVQGREIRRETATVGR